jgi:hypothetical protein
MMGSDLNILNGLPNYSACKKATIEQERGVYIEYQSNYPQYHGNLHGLRCD